MQGMTSLWRTNEYWVLEAEELAKQLLRETGSPQEKITKPRFWL
jgi:hypothetical protein